MYNRIITQTRSGLLKVVERMVGDEGIECMILGCTELPLILKEDACGITFVNTTRIHAESAVRFSLTAL
jgi:aspartate racemase